MPVFHILPTSKLQTSLASDSNHSFTPTEPLTSYQKEHNKQDCDCLNKGRGGKGTVCLGLGVSMQK